MDTQKKERQQTGEVLAVVLFFLAVGLIGGGLWILFRPLALIWAGLVVGWLAVCVSRTLDDGGRK